MQNPVRTLCIACQILAALGPVPAVASVGGETEKTTDTLGRARDLVKAGQWAAAL